MSNFKLKIATLNVQGLANHVKRRQIFKMLHENNYDIAFLQESHTSKSMEKRIRNEWGAKVIFSHGKTNARGVTTLFSKNLNISIVNSFRSEEGRYIITKVKIDNNEVLLCNVYAPNEDDPVFFSELFMKINNFQITNVIFGGDLNTLLDVEVKPNSQMQQGLLIILWKTKTGLTFGEHIIQIILPLLGKEPTL